MKRSPPYFLFLFGREASDEGTFRLDVFMPVSVLECDEDIFHLLAKMLRLDRNIS